MKHDKMIKDVVEKISIQKKTVDDFLDTQGSAKLWNYLIDISSTKSLGIKINKLRKDFSIPQKGYEWNQAFMDLPEEWLQVTPKIKQKRLKAEIKKICTHYGFSYVEWNEVFLAILFYDRIIMPMKTNQFNLCKVQDNLLSKTRDAKQSDNLTYPISLLISPYASERDIIDYIKKLYSYDLSELQSKYRSSTIEIGKYRKQTSRSRIIKKFLLENDHLSYKEKVEKWKLKYPVKDFPDQGNAGKIKSNEIKRKLK